jgi:outer membrane protein TolC
MTVVVRAAGLLWFVAVGVWPMLLPSRGWAQQPASSPGEALTLDQAIDIAPRDNRGMKNARLAVEKSDEEVAVTRTARLPSLHLYSLLSQGLVKNDQNVKNPLSGVLPGVGPFFTLSTPRKFTATFAAQLLLPITQQHRIGLTINLAKLNHQQEQEKLRSERQTLVDDVKRTYYGILQTDSTLESVREEVKSYRELDRVTGELVLQQVALNADRLQVQTRLAKTEYQALDLSNRLSTQKEQLNRLLGREVLTEFNVVPVPHATIEETDINAAGRRALEQRPEVREARLQIEQADVGRRIKQSEYIPDVSVGITALALRNFNDLVPRNAAAIGVVMSWEVFDWGRKRHQLAEASKTIEQARNGLHETEDQVLIDVSDRLRKLEQSRLDLRVAQLGQETAREMLRVNTEKYRVQTALLSDVLQSQASLADANHQYQQALLSFWTAKAEYEKALGEDR